ACSMSLALPVALSALWMSCMALSLPPVVEMGGAIVTAVEQEQLVASQQREQRQWIAQAEQQLQQLLNSKALSMEQVAQLWNKWTTEARGKPLKHKKLLKMLYPVLGAVVLAKLILLPLILKWLTALSASSFVMGKIALLTAGLLAFKSIMSAGHAHDRLEIIHSAAPALKSYHHAELSSSGSSWMPIRQHYVPLGMAKEPTYRVAPSASLDAKEIYKPFL
ncbi:hypothetical protein KR222_007437, partial [Zaprionus bogoriensis]